MHKTLSLLRLYIGGLYLDILSEEAFFVQVFFPNFTEPQKSCLQISTLES